jgi:signal transduction histidine kinase
MEILHPIDFPRFPVYVELGLYRICLELVNNTLKHADAAAITIRLSLKHDTLRLDYSDDGKGLAGSDGIGLGRRNIEARVNALGGNVTVDDTPAGSGFYARIELPVNQTL